MSGRLLAGAVRPGHVLLQQHATSCAGVAYVRAGVRVRGMSMGAHDAGGSTQRGVSAYARFGAMSLLACGAAFAGGVGGMFGGHGNAELQVNASRTDESVLLGEEEELVNWSGTHSVRTKRYFEPETAEELRAIVASAHAEGVKLRPVGSALSPNALGFCKDGMVNLVQMDEVLEVDKERGRITVQAGARVSQIVEALRPHGLTLRNYASIAEQQIGGLTQVGAHGTGVSIPPIDEDVVALKMVTPGAGEVVLSADDDDPTLLKLARTSVGLLGIITQVTLQCVPAHDLVERVFVASHAEVRANHAKWLSGNRHLRYMWIPHTDSVVVVTCNAVTGEGDAKIAPPKFSEAEKLAPARDLLKSVAGHHLSSADVDNLPFTGLRDELLAVDPLNTSWIRQVNLAEAEFWKRTEGARIDSSDRVLGFDCGGQQWVSEIVFPIPGWHGVEASPGKPGPASHDRGHPDIAYMESLLKLIEEENVPAPAPIEQRWSAPSTSPMSPAQTRAGDEYAGYSWVGIIMYLPEAREDARGGVSAVEDTRRRITNAFEAYRTLCETKLWGAYGAVEHWAKIEAPSTPETLTRLQERTSAKYPTEAFNLIRGDLFDPKRILSNDLTDAIFGGKPVSSEVAAVLLHSCPSDNPAVPETGTR